MTPSCRVHGELNLDGRSGFLTSALSAEASPIPTGPTGRSDDAEAKGKDGRAGKNMERSPEKRKKRFLNEPSETMFNSPCPH